MKKASTYSLASQWQRTSWLHSPLEKLKADADDHRLTPFIYSQLTTQPLDKLIPVKTLSRASRTGYKPESLHEWRTAFLQQQRLVISRTPDKCTEQKKGWWKKNAWQPCYAIKTPYCGSVAWIGKISDGWITSWPAPEPDWHYVHVLLSWTASRLDWELSHQQTRLNVKNITI